MGEALEKLLSQKAAAELLGIHPETLRCLSARGEIPALKIGRFWKYPPSKLAEWVQSKVNCRSLSCRKRPRS